MTAPQSFDRDDCYCAECDQTFGLPVIAVCPYCRSRQVRRLTVAEREQRARNDAESIRATARFHREHGDVELAQGWDNVADLLERKADRMVTP